MWLKNNFGNKNSTNKQKYYETEYLLKSKFRYIKYAQRASQQLNLVVTIISAGDKLFAFNTEFANVWISGWIVGVLLSIPKSLCPITHDCVTA